MLALVPVPTAPVGGAGDEHAKYAALSRILSLQVDGQFIGGNRYGKQTKTKKARV